MRSWKACGSSRGTVNGVDQNKQAPKKWPLRLRVRRGEKCQRGPNCGYREMRHEMGRIDILRRLRLTEAGVERVLFQSRAA
jgi:hypothetical protein